MHKRRKRSSVLTRAAVLDAAEKLFADRGFDGVSMRDLARRSGVSQPLILHHFGTKARLYAAVKQHAMRRFESIWPESDPGKSSPETLRQAIRNALDRIARDRNVLRLTSWSRLEDDEDLWPGEERLMRELSRNFAAGQKAGWLRRDLDPLLLTIMIEALILYWCEERVRLGVFFKNRAAMDSSYLRDLFRILESGIAAKARGPSRESLLKA